MIVGAEGDQSVAIGYETYATGNNSVAIGLETSASGQTAISLGDNTTASGARSLAMGFGTTASGAESLSMGRSTLAQGDRSTVFGMYNNPLVPSGTGIGPTSPILLLGNGDSNATRSNALSILKNGNAGIGIDTPEERLEVNGAIVISNSAAASPVEGTIRYTGTDYEGYDGTIWKQLTNTDNQTLTLSNNTLSISNGNSIPLTASSSQLVDSDANTKIQVEETSNDDVIRFDIAGQEKLKLLNSGNGKARIEFTNNDENIIIGTDAGNSLSNSNAVGNNNILIGSEAGSLTTNGSSNIFIGSESGQANTLGGFNTYVGDRSGKFKQSGNSNLFLGFGTGEFNSTGSGNVFIGRQVDMPGSTSNRLAIHNSSSTEETGALIYGEFDNGLVRINGELDINNAYRFPTSNGLANQVLATNTNGDLNWVDAPGIEAGGIPAPSKVYTTPATDFENGPNGSFGSAVAIHGTFASIGARTESISSDQVGLGRTYLYEQDSYGWYQADLFTPQNNDTRSFGIAVDMDNNNIVVGSDIGISNFEGRIFYHSYTAAGAVTKLVEAQSSDIEDLDRFGGVVALSGDYVAVGAYAKNGNQGKVYVFRYNGTALVEEEGIVESGTIRFGAAIDMDGDYMIVGAPTTSGSTGKAYIYKRSGANWNLEQTINSFGGNTGHAVTISGDKMAVSSTPNIGNQSVQIWKRTGTTWALEETVSAIDSRDRDQYGSSLSMDANKLVIGAAAAHSNAAQTGAVYSYIFNGTNWIFQKKHIAPNAQTKDYIGRSVKLHGSTFIAGGLANTKVFIDSF